MSAQAGCRRRCPRPPPPASPVPWPNGRRWGSGRQPAPSGRLDLGRMWKSPL